MEISETQIQNIIAKRQRRDAKMLIRMVMQTPLKDGPVAEVDGKMSIAALSKENLDVQTRIMLTMAGQASSGDVKAAEFLMKYGGYTPPVEQNVTVNLPRIINDIEFNEEEETKALEASYDILESPKLEKEEEEKDGEERCQIV